jgi:hypothetical protein
VAYQVLEQTLGQQKLLDQTEKFVERVRLKEW